MLKLQKKMVGNKEAGVAAVRHQDLVAQAAYYEAEKRGFQPGCELDDWLLAESMLGPPD
jgi:hypothetical protein